MEENLDTLWCQIYAHKKKDLVTCNKRYNLFSFDSIFVEGIAKYFSQVIVVVVAAIVAGYVIAKAVLHITIGLTKLPSMLLRSTQEEISQKWAFNIREG